MWRPENRVGSLKTYKDPRNCTSVVRTCAHWWVHFGFPSYGHLHLFSHFSLLGTFLWFQLSLIFCSLLFPDITFFSPFLLFTLACSYINFLIFWSMVTAEIIVEFLYTFLYLAQYDAAVITVCFVKQSFWGLNPYI